MVCFCGVFLLRVSVVCFSVKATVFPATCACWEPSLEAPLAWNHIPQQAQPLFPSKTSPPSTTAPGHTPLLLMVRVSVFARLRPSGGQTSPSWKMADSGSASLCPPEVLASAIMSALQAGNRYPPPRATPSAARTHR